jgi:hypothetical protein
MRYIKKQNKAFINNTQIVSTYILTKLIEATKWMLSKLVLLKLNSDDFYNLGNRLEQHDGLEGFEPWEKSSPQQDKNKLIIMNEENMVHKDDEEAPYSLSWEQVVAYFESLDDNPAKTFGHGDKNHRSKPPKCGFNK